MFLIEDPKRAILYTGDIRGSRHLCWDKAVLTRCVAEPSWVNAIVRQPIMIPYAHQLRVLDKVYLDTTFALDEEPYRCFPTKASGLCELLTELSAFPKDTIIHFNAWTLGYEDVFIAIAAHLRSQVPMKPFP